MLGAIQIIQFYKCGLSSSPGQTLKATVWLGLTKNLQSSRGDRQVLFLGVRDDLGGIWAGELLDSLEHLYGLWGQPDRVFESLRFLEKLGHTVTIAMEPLGSLSNPQAGSFVALMLARWHQHCHLRLPCIL